MAKFGLSQPVRRVEDDRLLTGKGRFVDDITMDDQAYGFVLRSSFAHARILSIDTSAAAVAPGVLGVFTGQDFAANGNNVLPCDIPIENRDGTQRADPRRPILCVDRVRHVGDNVAFVVAETHTAARDAADLIAVDYEELPAIADTATADQPGQPQVFDDISDNRVFDWEFGDGSDVDDAFTKAAHVTKLELINNRVVANSLEPRGTLATFDSALGEMTVYANTQGGWRLGQALAEDVLNMPVEKVRVITPDVGGGFGMKAMLYPEQAMAAWATKHLERPVKWMSDRSEAFVSDTMGRDHVTTAELAFDEQNEVLGMRVLTRANMGAYISLFAPFIPTGAALKVLPGVYDVKKLYYRVIGLTTNTTPVDAYRGAGRPESIYVVERLIEQAARELAIDAAELRRKCFVPAAAMPFTTSVGEIYDSGDFERVMDKATDIADWTGFAERREQAKARGALRGKGMCYFIESTMGPPDESAAIRFEGDMVKIYVGTQSNGQGHETAYQQLVHEWLGVPFDAMQVVQGDTALIPTGGGTGGSRSVTAQGWALSDASQVVIERGRKFAALEFEAAEADIEFADGRFNVVGTDRAIGVMELAAKARLIGGPEGADDGMNGKASIEVKQWTFPNGCHIAEVEIDPDTGVVRVDRYSVVDDFGRVINPMLLEGQIHGGIVQGIGQALMEHAVYDENAQLLSGSFMDYCMPRADDFPTFEFDTVEIPCENNPLGMKGCGEAGSVASTPAVINAIIDALYAAGIDRIDMPATAERIWRALKAAA